MLLPRDIKQEIASSDVNDYVLLQYRSQHSNYIPDNFMLDRWFNVVCFWLHNNRKHIDN